MAKNSKTGEYVNNQTQETAMPDTETTALSTTAPSALTQNKALAARLPEQYHDSVMFLERPTPGALMEIVSKLSPDWQEKAAALLRRMRPVKQGVHMRGGGFKIADIKLYQGVGNDAARPPKLPPGGFYTTDSKTIESPFIAAVIGVHETRTMWPPLGNAPSSPLCYSLDMLQGSKYGRCEECPNSKKLPRDGGCGTEVVAYLVDKDMTGVYAMKFSKSYYRAGKQLINLVNSGDEIWSRWVSFSEQEYKDGSKRWFGIKPAPVESKNQADVFSPKELDPVLRALSQAIDAEVYFPALADLYDRSRGGGATLTVQGETMDEPLTGTGAPDYSNA